jgi:hypothetical protein
MASAAGASREQRTIVVDDWTACLRRERDGWMVGDVTRLSENGAARMVTPLPLGRRSFPTPEQATEASADWLRATGFVRVGRAGEAANASSAEPSPAAGDPERSRGRRS